MYRIVTILTVASMAFAIATPSFAQNRFEMEAKQRQADREEREAIRRAEHPELYEKPAAKPVAAAPAQEAAAPTPTQAATEPVAAAPATTAPAQ